MADFPRIHYIEEILHLMADSQCEPQEFAGRIIFMSMFNGIGWRDERNKAVCIMNCRSVSVYARYFPRGHRSFAGPDCEQKWYRTDKYNGQWDRIADAMLSVTAESGHPILRATSACGRGTLKSRGSGKTTKHLCGGPETIDVIFAPLFL